MRTIKSRVAPEAPNYFAIQIGDQEVQCRLPNFAARQELLGIWLSVAPGGENGGNGAEVYRAVSAVVGCCWWGTDRALEAEYFEHRADLLRFGDLVLTELEDAGFKAAEIIEAASACMDRIADSYPTESEVKAAEDFTEAEMAG